LGGSTWNKAWLLIWLLNILPGSWSGF
jgi:hypothetical protein